MLWVSLTYARTKSYLATRRETTVYGVTTEGRVRAKRWEWGIGKGQWKRMAKRHAKVYDLQGHVRAVYFLIGSFYRLEYTGTNAELLYNDIR